MKLKCENGKSTVSFAKGTVLQFGQRSVTLVDDAEFEFNGELSYGAVLETIAAAKQVQPNIEAFKRTKDGQIITYNAHGGVASVEDKPKPVKAAPKSKAKAKPKAKGKK